jgi:hypothetical protein
MRRRGVTRHTRPARPFALRHGSTTHTRLSTIYNSGVLLSFVYIITISCITPAQVTLAVVSHSTHLYIQQEQTRDKRSSVQLKWPR